MGTQSDTMDRGHCLPASATTAAIRLGITPGGSFTVDWMPGQIDGRHVAFTGDNIFAHPADPTQTGHEAVVAHNIAIHAPAGITPEPATLEGRIEPGSTARIPLRLKVSPDAREGLRIITFDITLDGRRYGQLFDLILDVSK